MKACKEFNRIIAMLLIAIMIIPVFPFLGEKEVFAVDPNMSIGYNQTITAEAGSTITVPVNITDNQGIAGIGLIFTYDQDVLIPVKVNATELTAGGTYNDSIETSKDNSFKVIWASPDNMTSDGTIFNITFNVSSSAKGNTAISISYVQDDTFNENFEDVVLNCNDIKINVPQNANNTTIHGAGETHVLAGDDILIPIMIDNGDSLDSLSFDLLYDEDAFDYSLASQTQLAGGCEISDIEGGCHFDLSSIDTTQSEGTLLLLPMTVKQSANGSYTFNLVSNDVKTQSFEIIVDTPQPSSNAKIYCNQQDSGSSNIVSIGVNIQNNPGLAAFRFTMTYDPEKLTPVSAQKTSGLQGSFDNTIGDSTGSFDVLWFNSDNYTSDGLLYTVNFEVKDGASGSTLIGMRYSQADTCDENMEDVALNMEDYTVTISDAYPVLLRPEKTKIFYYYGETLNTDDLTVKIKYSNGEWKDVTNFFIDYSTLDMSPERWTEFTVGYTEGSVTVTEKVGIYVYRVVESIDITKTKTDYHIGDELNLDDLRVYANYSHGETFEVALYTTNASELDMNTAGDKTLIVTFEEAGITVTSSIVIHVSAELTSISAAKVNNEYEKGEILDLNDLIVHAHYSDGTQKEITDYSTNAAAIDMNTVGDKTLIITYSEDGVLKSCELTIKVNEPVDDSVKSITVTKVKKEYHVGDDLNCDDVEVTAYYTDGTSKIVENYEINNNDIDMTTAGTKSVIVTYTEKGKTVVGSVSISVTAVLKSIKAFKSKSTYNYGDVINTNDIIVLATYTDETQKQVLDFTTNVNELDTSSGNKTLIVSYTEDGITVSTNLTITINATVLSLSVGKTKTVYNVGDTLNIDDLTVTALYTDRSTKVVTDYFTNMKTIDMSSSGNKTLIVIYEENGKMVTSSVPITVLEKVAPEKPELLSIWAVKEKTVYEYGETIDTNDMVVLATFSDGKQKEVSGYTTNVSEIDMSTAGEKVLQVNYVEDGVLVSTQVDISVRAVLQSIHAEKDRIEYTVKEALDLSDLTVTADYNDNTSKTVTNYRTNISEIDMSTPGTKTLVIIFEDNGKSATASIDIVVKEEIQPQEKKLESITASKVKQEYYCGDNLNTDDITVTARYSDGSQSEVSGFMSDTSLVNMSTPGLKTIQITYEENGITKTAAIPISVQEKSGDDKKTIVSIDVFGYDTVYYVDQFFWLDETIDQYWSVKANFSDGSSKLVYGYETNEDKILKTAGKKNLIVSYTYEGKTVTKVIPVTVKEPTDIKKAKVSGIKNLVYRKNMYGYIKKLAQNVWWVERGSDILYEDTDYYLYLNYCSDVGTASVEFDGMYKYKGTLRKTFKILPKGTTLKKLKKQKKAFKVTWKKQAMKMSKSRITGYQIRYSTSKKMKKAKLVNVKGYKKTSKVIKKLKAKKKYFVQIRTYKTVAGKKYFSSWSKKKTVKTK